MAVFVDDMHLTQMGQFGRMKMSHMIADSPDELLAMADKIGVARKWIQRAGTHLEHFDVSLGARQKAVQLGAVEITMKELAQKTRERRNNHD